jgi:hypothetical protein
MNDLTVALRTSAWWLVPLIALLVLLGLETDWGQALRTTPPAAEPIPPKPVVMALLPEFEMRGGIQARSETVERTLFNPTRRPAPPVAAEAAKPRIQRGQFTLTGTLLLDGKSTAFLRENAGGKSRRVQQGEQVNGMTVAEVQPDRVKLTLGDESEELTLKVALNPKPTVQPAAPAAPPAQVPPQAQAAAQGAGQPAGAQARPAGTQPGAPAQSLAERREAARAAAAAAAAAQQGNAPAQPAAAPAVSPPTNPDPGWAAMEQRYKERAAARNR